MSAKLSVGIIGAGPGGLALGMLLARMLYGPNTNVGSNSVIFMLEAQAPAENHAVVEYAPWKVGRQ